MADKRDPIEEETYYTVQELVERFKVTKQTIYNWIKSGRVRAVRFGNRILITRTEVLRLLHEIKPGEIEEEDQEDE